MSEKKSDSTDHRPIETKVVTGDVGKAGHLAPSGDGPVLGSGHIPARVNPTNATPSAPPPKRDDAESSAKPPK